MRCCGRSAHCLGALVVALSVAVVSLIRVFCLRLAVRGYGCMCGIAQPEMALMFCEPVFDALCRSVGIAGIVAMYDGVCGSASRASLVHIDCGR